MRAANEEQTAYDEAYRKTAIEITKIAGPITTRALVIAARFWLKRYIYAQAGCLETYPPIAALENLLFTALFTGQRMITVFVRQVPADQPAEVGHVTRHALLFTTLFTTFFTTPVCLTAHNIFYYLGQPKNVVDESKTYFYFFAISLMLESPARVLGRAFLGLKKTTPPLIADIFRVVIDLSIAAILTNGYFSFPKMNVTGGAVSSAVSAALTLIGSIIYLYFAADLKQYAFFKHDGIEPKKIAEIAKKSLPPSAGTVLEYAAQFAAVLYIGSTDPAKSIGIEVAKSYATVVGFFLSGVSVASSILVANALRDNLPDRHITTTTYFISNGLVTLFGFLTWIFSRPYTTLFIPENPHNTAIIDNTISILHAQIIIEFFDSLRSVTTSALEAHKDVLTTLKINIAFIFMLNLLLTTLCKFVFHADTQTIYWATAVGYTTAGVAMTTAWKFGIFNSAYAEREPAPASPTSAVQMVPSHFQQQTA